MALEELHFLLILFLEIVSSAALIYVNNVIDVGGHVRRKEWASKAVVQTALDGLSAYLTLMRYQKDAPSTR